MADQLPNGWTSASLKDIAELNPRHPKNLDDAAAVTFVPMAALSETKWSFRYSEEKPLGKVRQGYTHFAEGDVLFAKITPCMENGKAGLAIGLKNGLGCGTTELHVIRPDGRVEAKYLYHYLHQESFRKDAAQTFTGTAGQLRVPVSFIRNAEIPLPPINEQRRIVAKLEKLLAKVEACQERLDKIPVILKRFRQSVLTAACSGRLTRDWRGDGSFESEMPANWKAAKLGDLVSLVTSGSRGWAKYYSQKGAMFIRAQNINADCLDLYDIAYVDLPNRTEGLRTKVRKDDLLVTITGANVTKSAIVLEDLDNAYISQHVALVRLKDIKWSPFIFYWLLSPAHGRAQLLESAYGQGKSGLNLDNIRNVNVWLPTGHEQHEIVRRVKALFKIADQIEERYKKAKAHIDKLTQSILAKAFCGELVPQDPNDEPASALLERIHASKIADSPISKAVHTH